MHTVMVLGAVGKEQLAMKHLLMIVNGEQFMIKDDLSSFFLYLIML